MADLGLLEFCVREHLNKIAQRRMVVFDPLKVVITNYQLSNESSVMSDAGMIDSRSCMAEARDEQPRIW